MARYIDDEHLMQKLSRMIYYCEENKDKKFNALSVLFQVGDAIMDCPSADVAPKSEVAIEIIQDIAKACAPHDHHLNSLDFEIGYITAMNQVIAKLEEIKKKYTEGE